MAAYANEDEAFLAGRSSGVTWTDTWVPGGPWTDNCTCEMCRKQRAHAAAWKRGWREGKAETECETAK